MTLSRRSFLRHGAITAAALAAPTPFARSVLGPRDALASGPADAIFVLVQLEGGNDGLNTVIPATAGNAQRTLYDAKRPNLGIPVASLGATLLGLDPTHGGQLALHPSMTHLKSLFDAGKVAVINGVGYPSQSLSHFRSEDIWYGGIPSTQQFASGWFGRFLEANPSLPDLVTVSLNDTLGEMMIADDANVLAITDVDNFILPDDPLFPDLAAKKLALQTAYAEEAATVPPTAELQTRVGVSGDAMLAKLDVYATVNDGTWGSALDALATVDKSLLSRRLKQVASILRHDTMVGTPTEARFFHVRMGGFDTHTNQVTRHEPLLRRTSAAIKAFHDDVTALGLASRTVILTVSEFGRRPQENGSATTVGTDHGAAAVQFAVGDPVIGGIYGGLPSLSALDSNNNLVFHTDFRALYATIIDRWLNGAHAGILGGSFTPVPFLPA